MNTTTDPRLGELLAVAGPHHIHVDPSWWGFGGAHGGLVLALATSAMRTPAVGDLRSVTGHFLRPVREEMSIETREVRHGRLAQVVTASVTSGGNHALDATATYGRWTADVAAISPPMPDVPGPERCDVFALPTEIVPFASHTELRPATTARPYAGGDVAELAAWIRIVDDDRPVDDARLIVLVDSLAPSYAAVLRELVLIPTVELTVRPGTALRTATSPWALIRARSTGASSDGWIEEHIDAWSPDGAHLGSAHQLRLARPASVTP